MSISLIDNAKYSSWKETHNFDNCKLNRKEYGHFLANYLIGEKDGFVLNLNGSWGTGKTEFLKRFYVELMDRGHPTIYIDAWESDFSQEPLTVVASELLNQLERLMDGAISDSIITEVKSALGKALKGTLVGLAGIASAKLFNDSAIGIEAINKLLDEAPQNITKQLAENYQSQIEAIINTRDALGSLAESLQTVNGSELPVIVLIDELDRCRPTYAIEMLEVVKHFFSIKGFVFVIATDTDQLCHSITSVYGDNFDSNQYLKRFFNRKSSLPIPDIYEYISLKINDFCDCAFVELFPEHKSNCYNIEKIQFSVSTLSVSYDLKIRDIDQLLDKLNSCLRTISELGRMTNKSQCLNIAALITGLIEQDLNMESYHSRKDFNPTTTIPKNDFQLSPDVSAYDYIKLSLETTIFRENTFQGYSGPQVHHSPPMREYYNNMRGPRDSGLKYQLIYSLALQTENYDEQNRKYWLWSDMKRVIELAGTLE
jgi:hypothetical protein